MQTIKFAPQVCPSNQTPTNNHHLQTQFEGLPLTTNPQIGRQTLNKFDYRNLFISSSVYPNSSIATSFDNNPFFISSTCFLR